MRTAASASSGDRVEKISEIIVDRGLREYAHDRASRVNDGDRRYPVSPQSPWGVGEADLVRIPTAVRRWDCETETIGNPDRLALAVLAHRHEEELIVFCRDRLAHFKCPTSIQFVEGLPRTATGKLQKFKLREAFWDDTDRRIN